MRHAVSVVLLLAAGLATAAAEPVTGTPASIAAPDGTKIAATYYAGDRPGPGILLLHQCNMDRSSWSGLAESLAREGFHVLTMDYRGFGESGGRRHLELPSAEQNRLTNEVWPGDVDRAFQYLRAQPGVQPIYGAGGASCGVNQSIQLSHRHPEVNSLVLLSGLTDRAGRQHLASKSSPPLMLASADDDDAVVRFMSWLDASSGNPANRFVEYEKGGHGTVMFGSHPELPGEIVAWYEATLQGKGKPASTPNAARRGSPEVRLLMMMDESGGFGRIAETLGTERRKDPKSPLLDARFVNFLGYQAIQAGDGKSAIAILQTNVDARPASANAWDSLGEAYLAAGRRDDARRATEKALSLVDSDPDESPDRRKLIRESAEARMKRLGGPS